MRYAIHLCQPDGRKSCGACCGMYNVEWASRERVTAILRARAAAFRALCHPHDPASLRAYKAARLTLEAPAKLLPLLRNCPFLGLLDDASGRVGCMVHPLLNDGVDGRDCGAYDRHVCEEYLCPAYTLLSLDERRFVIAACKDDSYLYGLVLNDVPLIRDLLTLAADLCGEMPRMPRLLAPPVLDAAHAYFALKADWPFADPESGVIGAYIPDGDDDVARRVIDYADLGRLSPSPYDRILCSLGSLFDDPEALDEAEALIHAHLVAFADAYAATRADAPRPRA